MPEKRLNILLLFTDQQRFDTINAAGYPHMVTPNLDRLVNEGCLFRNAYSPCPVCVPARHHLLTGTTVRKHGFTDNVQPPMDASIPTLASLLSTAGYCTKAIGKMHFRPSRNQNGFDSLELMESHPARREDDEYAMYLKSVGLGHIQNLHGVWNVLYEAPQRSIIDDKHHGSTWVADRTIAFLESLKNDSAFFCWSSWLAPHPPLSVPESVRDLYKGKDLPKPIASITEENTFTKLLSQDLTWPPEENRADFFRRRQEAYYAQISFVDQQIGRVLDALEKSGKLDETLIIFSSDHGEMLGDHNAIQKAQPYESASRIPLVMRYPRRLEKGSVREEFFDLNDVLPTVLDLIGITHPDPSSLPGESVFREDKDRSVQYLSLGRKGRRFATVRDQRYKYTYYYGAGILDELFDLELDPGETMNLLRVQPEAPFVIELREKMKTLVKEFETQWGVLNEAIDDKGELMVFAQDKHWNLEQSYQAQVQSFPEWPDQISDPEEAEAMNNFAYEALECVKDQSPLKLNKLNLETWRKKGGDESFFEYIRSHDL